MTVELRIDTVICGEQKNPARYTHSCRVGTLQDEISQLLKSVDIFRVYYIVVSRRCICDRTIRLPQVIFRINLQTYNLITPPGERF